MKKLLILGFAAALGFAPAAAKGLTPHEALSRAMGSAASFRAKAPLAHNNKMKVVYEGARISGEDASAYYVFSNPGGGFVIASGDDRMRPLLAIADSGEFRADQMPENMRIQLQQYEAEAGALAAGSEITGNVFDNYARWDALKPLLSTQWNQLSPYNSLSPTLNGRVCPTGCVATAMAQLVNYYKYAKGSGTNSYNNQGTTVSFDFGAWNPDFSLMADQYENAQVSQAQIDEVARLMKACGVAVNTSYSAGGSGAGDPIDGLVKYMGYDPKSRMISRSYFTSSADWESVAYELIAAGHPLYYCGSGQGGHAFVVDGYLSDGLFHINWGWGGISNGYFALSALTPSAQGAGSFLGGYNIGQKIGLFLKPGENMPALSVSIPALRVQFMPSYLSFIGKVSSMRDDIGFLWRPLSIAGGNTATVGLTLLLKSADGSTDDILLDPVEFVNAVNGESYWNFKVEYSYGQVPAGKYLAYPVFLTEKGGKYWHVEPNSNDKTDHFELTVDANGNRSYVVATALPPTLAAGSLKVNDLYANDGSCEFSSVLTNYGDEDFCGTLSARMYNGSGNEVKNISTYYVNLRAGESTSQRVYFTAPAAGAYTIKFFDNDNNKLLDTNTLAVTVKSGQRPNQALTTGTTGLFEAGIWIDESFKTPMPLVVKYGEPFAATSALYTDQSKGIDADYYLAFFPHGNINTEPVWRYHMTPGRIPTQGAYKGVDFSVVPEVAPGLYTYAFVDADNKRLSYTADFEVVFEADGLMYRCVAPGEMQVYAATAALPYEFKLPQTVTCGGVNYTVTEVGPGAFAGCGELEELTVPSTVKSIGIDAFRGAIGLKVVKFDGATPPFENAAVPFYGHNRKAEFYACGGGYDSYAKVFKLPMKVYAWMEALKAQDIVKVEQKKSVEVALDVTPSTGYNPGFEVEVADPAIASAEVTAPGVVTVTGLASGRTEVKVTSVQPGNLSATFMVEVGELSGISEIRGSEATRGGYYDLTGRRVVTPSRGVYIDASGRKCLVR